MAGFVAIASGGTTAAYSTNGTTWNSAALPTAANWQAVAWSGSVFCAIAKGSNIAATSPDGTSWTQRTLPVSADWESITWNGTVFCAVDGLGLHSINSTDGITWNTVQLPGVLVPKWSFCSNGSVTIGVGGGDYPYASVIRSSNGTSWTQHALPTVADWRAVAWNGTVFCAISWGSNIAATSPDGISWTQRTLPSTELWASIAWNGSVFFAVSAGTAGATSTDGINWTARTVNADRIWSNIAVNGSTFLIVSHGDDDCETSTDGITWIDHALTGIKNWSGLAYNGSVFCTLENHGGSTCVSTDGTANIWSNKSLPSSADWIDVAWNGTVFCAVAFGSNKAATSPDGTTWTARTLPVSADWNSIVWDGTNFIVSTSYSNVYATSTDGTTWTQRAFPEITGWDLNSTGSVIGSAIAVLQRNIGVGVPTTSLYSTDNGSTWTYYDSLVAGDFSPGAGDSGVMCVVGYNSNIVLQTLNGYDFNQYTLPSVNNWISVARSGTRFAAIAYGGTSAASSTDDGQTWTARTLPTSTNWKAVAGNGSIFAAISTGTSIAASSPTGVTWTQRTLPSSANWQAIAAGNVFLSSSLSEQSTPSEALGVGLRLVKSLTDTEYPIDSEAMSVQSYPAGMNPSTPSVPQAPTSSSSTVPRPNHNDGSLGRIKGVAFPFKKGSLPAAASDDELIKMSIQQILLTSRGERIMTPEFGSSLKKFLFDPNNSAVRDLIRIDVISSLTNNEPRIELRDVHVYQDPEQKEFVNVYVSYVVLSSQKTDSLTLSLGVN